LYGDYDRSAFSDESLGLIVVAELTSETQPSYADAHSL
jgi:hypothetical protein